MSPVTFFKETRQVGFRKAWSHFIDRRHLPVVGYLILAGFTGFAFQQERSHSNENRAALASETRSVLVKGCERQNVLRVTLRGLILQGIPQVKQYVKEGTLTPAQGERSIASSRDAAKKLAPTDCARAYPEPK